MTYEDKGSFNVEVKQKWCKSASTSITVYYGADFQVLVDEKWLNVFHTQKNIWISKDLILDAGRSDVKNGWNIKSDRVFGGISYRNGIPGNISVSGGVRMY